MIKHKRNEDWGKFQNDLSESCQWFLDEKQSVPVGRDNGKQIPQDCNELKTKSKNLKTTNETLVVRSLSLDDKARQRQKVLKRQSVKSFNYSIKQHGMPDTKKISIELCAILSSIYFVVFWFLISGRLTVDLNWRCNQNVIVKLLLSLTSLINSASKE